MNDELGTSVPLLPMKCRRATKAGTLLAILISVLLLETGHQAQRPRSPKHESLEALQLRDRPAAVSLYRSGHRS